MRNYKTGIAATLLLLLSACGGGGGTEPGPLSGTYQGTLKVKTDSCKSGAKQIAGNYAVEQYDNDSLVKVDGFGFDLHGTTDGATYLVASGGDDSAKCNTNYSVGFDNITDTTAEASYSVTSRGLCYPGQQMAPCTIVYTGVVTRNP